MPEGQKTFCINVLSTQIYANGYRFDVLILDVHYVVINLVLRVWRPAPGLANIKGHVTCPTQRLAIVCHAINVAPNPSHVAIDVREFVVKCARRDTATYVPISSNHESMSSR